jgi:hypothetical protein
MVASLGTGTERALALRQLAERSRSGASGPTAGGVSALQAGLQGYIGLAVQLLIGWLVVGMVTVVLVELSAPTVSVDAPRPLPIVLPAQSPGDEEDPDPRNPLIRCILFETHTHCIHEAT